MFDQGNHASEYHGQSNPPRGAAAPPHPPFSQGPPGHLAQFPQGLPVPPPSEIQHGAPPHPSIQQAPPGPFPFPYQHVLPAPPAQQPLHLPPQGPISMGQPYSFIRSGPLFPSSMPGNNANHVAQGLQPMPPPLRVFPPQPLPPPPRQSMYRIPPPPPHGVQHMPVPPPPAPPSFVSITPALFMPPGNTSAQDTHPPSLPPPPPPPPPPPSSPPPLPPSPPPASPAPDISVAISKTPSDDNRICIDIVDVSVDPVLSTYNMPPGGSSHVEVDDIKEKVSLGVQEAWGGSPSPPPRPVEEEVVRRIEVLCKSIAKVGPDFENFARAKEVGNPHFSFLFGGEPGSSAAAAREYFQWVKKKCCLEPNLSKDSKDIVLPEPPITEASPKALIFENKEQGISPTVSDMDVEDDNNSSFMEDVSPARSLPGAAELDLDGRVQHCVRQLHDVSSIVSVSPTTGACKVMEAGVGNVMESPNVFVKDRSPFRLIQGYASDDSGEDKREYAGNIHNITASTSSIEGILDSHKDRKSEYCLNFSTKAAKNTDTGTELQGYSVKSSTIQNEASPYGSPSPRRRTSPIVIRPKLDAICNGNDPGADEQDDQGLDCRVGSEALRNHYSVEGGRMDVNSQLKRHHPEEAQRPALPNLDEFGRLVREGFSDSDSDGMQYSKKHGKKGKTRSGSRSPQESRRRWRSRSPRKRYKRSRSSSSSPRRSKSPPTFRQTNMHAKREQPSECFNFIRGRCFRGASCRFLHRDAGQRRDRKQQYRGFHQDSVDYDLREATQAHETWDEGRPKKSKDILHNQRFTVGSEKEYASRTQDNSREGSFKDQISQEIVSQTEKEQQVEMLKDSPSIINSKKEEITLVLLDSSQPLPADSLVQSVPAHKLESSSNGNDLGESGSGLQTFQAGHCSSISDPPNVQYLVPAVQPSSDQASTPQENQGGSPVRQLSARYGPMAQSSDQLVHSTEVSVSHSLAPVVNSHPSHQVVHEHLPLFPSDNVTAPFAAEHLRENSLPPSSSYHPQPSPPVMLQSQQPTMGSDYHSQNVHPPSQNLPSFPSLSQPPPVSLLTGISGRPSFPTEYPRPQFEQNPSPAGNFAQDIMRSYHPVELSLSHQHLSQMDGFNRTLPVGNQQNPLFSREEWFLHHPGPEGPRIMSGTLQSGSHMHHQSSLCENARISLSAGGPSSFSHGNIVQPSLPFPGAVVQHEFQSLMGDRPPPRFLQREEFSSIRGLPYLQQQTSYGPQHPPSNPSGHGTADPSFQGFPSSFAESNLPHHVPDIGLPKFSITTRYNPFASTFEHTPSSLNISSGISGQANVLEYNMKYDLSHSSGHGLGGGPGSRMATLSSDLGPSQGHLLPRAGDYSYGTSAELPSVQKQFGAEPASGLPYDPLFDSIEPSTSLIKKVDVRQKQNLRAGDVGNMSKLSSLPRPVDIENNSKEKGVALAESEADELGEVATDVEVGVVENASPQPDANDWSPDIPDNVGNLAAGSIETDQVRSSGKSKKSKESRSSKVFKNAIASFVKEVLKPSWRQGNMSKEAFKTIVKKTVDKVYNSAHHIPKSQAKINQYVESSERKITKLVMGYVNKYVKM